MKIELEFEHHPETEVSLENWTATYGDTQLIISRTEEWVGYGVRELVATYHWRNNYTGDNYRYGSESSLQDAVRAAVASQREIQGVVRELSDWSEE